jgi:uncharacterized C2H2 Zn-finger protein
MDAIVANKCYNCGKVFRNEAEYNRHKNRKTPCSIRDIKQGELMNPNRCIYCNKIYSKKENLTRHHKTCKIKNANLPADAIKLRDDMLKLRIERQEEREKNNRLLIETREKLNAMRKKLDELEKELPIAK